MKRTARGLMASALCNTAGRVCTWAYAVGRISGQVEHWAAVRRDPVPYELGRWAVVPGSERQDPKQPGA